MKKAALIFLLGFSSALFAEKFETSSNFTVCFTPGQDCTQVVVDAIHGAVNHIWVQAYSFTSWPIEQALLEAQERGVTVEVLLDKSVLVSPKNIAESLAQNHIPVWIDYQPGIAHNKVMIFDQTRVITGSFNFTRAAQTRNAENLLLIDDANLAQKYLNNWNGRQQVSRHYEPVGEDKINVPDLPKPFHFFEWLKQSFQRVWEMIKTFFVI